MESGKRQWKPIVIVKRWSASSPQFLQALVTNELLSSVTIEFESILANGTEGTYYTIQLTNASVTEVRQYIGSVHEKPADTSEHDTSELETIMVTFQKINVTSVYAQTTFSDDWLE